MTDITEIEVVEQGPAGQTGAAGVVQSVAGLAQATITVAELQAALTLAACAYLDVGTGLVSSGGNLNVSGLTTSEFAANVIDTDTSLTANSDTRIASQKAVKTYADQLIAANDAMVFEGVIDCSVNPNYPAADRGATYRVSVAGKIGGASGVNVEAGDILLCLTDGTASGDQATVGSEWSIIQTNIDGAVVGPASATDGHVALFDSATGKLIKDGGAATAAGLAMLGAADAAAQAALWSSLSPTFVGLTLSGSLTLASGAYAVASSVGTGLSGNALQFTANFNTVAAFDYYAAAGAGGLHIRNTSYLGFGVLTSAPDLILRRPAAATLALGAADAAAPVAQALQVQSVVAGTTDTAGAAWSFYDSAGTGTGASGGFNFYVHPAGSTGTAQNAAALALTIGSTNVDIARATSYLRPLKIGGHGSIYYTSNAIYMLDDTATAGIFFPTGVVNYDLGLGTAGNMFLSTSGAGIFQLGKDDTATGAVAQTLQVQSNTGAADGPDFTIKGSNSGAANSGGRIVFQTAYHGAYQNTAIISYDDTRIYGAGSSAHYIKLGKFSGSAISFEQYSTYYDGINSFKHKYDPTSSTGGNFFEYGTRNASVDSALYPAVLEIAPRGYIGTSRSALRFDNLGRLSSATQLTIPTIVAAPVTIAELPAAPTDGMICSISDGDSGLVSGDTPINSGAGATPYIVAYKGAWKVII